MTQVERYKQLLAEILRHPAGSAERIRLTQQMAAQLAGTGRRREAADWQRKAARDEDEEGTR